MHSLIICPVGNPMTFDDRFDKENHWRFCKPNRLWETVVIVYNNFEPEENSYDKLIRQKGSKWELIKNYLKTIDCSKYEYIGFMDDDLITDIDNVNRAIKISTENDLKIFQMSVAKDSDIFWPILVNKPGIKYTKTNFIEVMGPFIHTSLLPLCQELWDQYEIESGWGFDKVLCDLTKTDAAVIHASQMYHPKKVTSYDKTKAFAELDDLTYNVFPKFMKYKYNEDWSFKESQIEKQIIMETT